MKIAIIEICLETHYTLTNTLIKTYTTDPLNQIVVFTTEPIAKILNENGVAPNTTYVIFDKEKQTAAQFLQDIEKQFFDRMHIPTIKKYYMEYSYFFPKVNLLFLHVHNVDMWFDYNLKNSYKNMLANIKIVPDKFREVARFMRDIVVRNQARTRIIKNFSTLNFCYIVHSLGQMNYLSQFVDEKRIVIFPSDIYEPRQKSSPNGVHKKKIRICIPGIVTDTRRDYTGLLDMLLTISDEIKDKIVFDFLGFVDEREGHLIQKMKKLISRGVEIVYSATFVDAKVFDENLEKADILLNNQIVEMSFTSKYGVSKESGFVFKMIRGAKPGIMPATYKVDKEFENSLIYFESAEHLKEILLLLANGTIHLDKYKRNAIEMAENYTPLSLYKRIMNVNNKVKSF